MLTDLAEKVGETTSNTDDNRKRKINSAYNFICNQRPWWFLESSGTSTTTTALYVTLPTDFRVYHPLNPVKLGNAWQVLIPFEDLQMHDGTAGVVSLPTTLSKNKVYIYGSSLYFVRDSMTAAQTVTHYYYKKITALNNTTDEPLIPAEFREIISLYAAGMHLLSQGGKEADEGTRYLKLYDDYLKQMESEDSLRRDFGVKRRAKDPEEVLVYQR